MAIVLRESHVDRAIGATVLGNLLLILVLPLIVSTCIPEASGGRSNDAWKGSSGRLALYGPGVASAWLLVAVHSLWREGPLRDLMLEFGAIANPGASLGSSDGQPRGLSPIARGVAIAISVGYPLAAFLGDYLGARRFLDATPSPPSTSSAAECVLRLTLILQFLALLGSHSSSNAAPPSTAAISSTLGWAWLLLLPATVPASMPAVSSAGGGVAHPLHAAQAVAAVLLCLAGALAFFTRPVASAVGTGASSSTGALSSSTASSSTATAPAVATAPTQRTTTRPPPVASLRPLVFAPVMLFWPLLGAALLWSVAAAGLSGGSGSAVERDCASGGSRAWRLAFPPDGGAVLPTDGGQLLAVAAAIVWVLWAEGCVPTPGRWWGRRGWGGGNGEDVAGLSAASRTTRSRWMSRWRWVRPWRTSRGAERGTLAGSTIHLSMGRKTGPQESLLPLFVED